MFIVRRQQKADRGQRGRAEKENMPICTRGNTEHGYGQLRLSSGEPSEDHEASGRPENFPEMQTEKVGILSTKPSLPLAEGYLGLLNPSCFREVHGWPAWCTQHVTLHEDVGVHSSCHYNMLITKRDRMSSEDLLSSTLGFCAAEGFSIITSMNAKTDNKSSHFSPQFINTASEFKSTDFRMPYLDVGLRAMPSSVFCFTELWVTLHRPSWLPIGPYLRASTMNSLQLWL